MANEINALHTLSIGGTPYPIYSKGIQYDYSANSSSNFLVGTVVSDTNYKVGVSESISGNSSELNIYSKKIKLNSLDYNDLNDLVITSTVEISGTFEDGFGKILPLTTMYIGSDDKRFDSGYFRYLYALYGFYQSSDERLKTFGNSVDIDLDKLAKLKKSYFTWKEKNDKQQIGVSAQEIQELYPELVTADEKGELSVAYDKLSVIALAAIDELHKKNKELEDRLKKLEDMICQK